MRRVKTEIMSKPLAVPSGDGVARVLVGTPSGWAPGIGWSASESSSVTSVDDCDKCEVCEPRRPPSGGESGGVPICGGRSRDRALRSSSSSSLGEIAPLPPGSVTNLGPGGPRGSTALSERKRGSGSSSAAAASEEEGAPPSEVLLRDRLLGFSPGSRCAWWGGGGGSDS